MGTEAIENSDYKLVWEDEFEGDKLSTTAVHVSNVRLEKASEAAKVEKGVLPDARCMSRVEGHSTTRFFKIRRVGDRYAERL